MNMISRNFLDELEKEPLQHFLYDCTALQRLLFFKLERFPNLECLEEIFQK